jgi:tetratricopeptide (TPR) repeat protein
MEFLPNQPTLCLNMIVKNESRIIERLFNSVSKIIDSYCICDTGSTDNTVEIIEAYFKERNIPGKIVYEPFKNFCHNRNFALQSCLGMSDYVLLLDCDMVLEIKQFDKSMLTSADSFDILQGNDSFYYQNLRIVRNNGLYKYIGVTHEYIDRPSNNRNISVKKNELFIQDFGDGGSKGDKYERDIRLLTDGIKEEPNNVRYHFYLANSYHDSGRYEEAINTYKKRIEMGGWKEEVWYSYFRIGKCYQNMGKFSDALYYWLEGYNFYPQRLEGLYDIIKHYRLNGKNKLAFQFYKISKEILDKNENRDQYLFLHNDVYTHSIYYEYIIIAFYNGITNVNDQLVPFLNNSNNDSEINNALSNLKFYKHILERTKTFVIDNTVEHNVNNENIKFTSSSSCLIKNSLHNGYLMNIRYVNYYIDGSGRYHNCEKHIITINKFIEMDKDLNIIKSEWMDLAFDGRLYIGVEDVRIYFDKDKNLQFIGTGYHTNKQIGIVSGDYNTDNHKLVTNELKQTFKNSGCEKNWVFVDFNNDTHIVYDWYPLKICKQDENNVINVVETKKMPKLFTRVRGSTCGFVYNKQVNTTSFNSTNNISLKIVEKEKEDEKEIWFINHIVSYDSPRHYYHIISVFDSHMNLLRYSAPFKFEGEAVEYCLSIIVEDDRVLINYSTWDRTTRIGVYDKKYIDSIVKYN